MNGEVPFMHGMAYGLERRWHENRQINRGKINSLLSVRNGSKIEIINMILG